MTLTQVGGLVFFIAVFVVSFSLGRYFRRLDDRRDAERMAVQPIRPVQEWDLDPRQDYVYSVTDQEKLKSFMKRYYEEIDRLVLGYHTRALLEGEDFARAWLLEQTGRHK